MSGLITTNRPLAGGTKQYLDDLLELERKTTEQMARGIRDGYLDRDGAIDLANRLGVEPPRVKREFRMYFELTSVYAVTVMAYDEDEAEAEAARLHDENVRNESIYHGRRTRFRDVNPGSSGPQHRYSAISRQRPEVDQPLESHPRTVTRAQQIRDQRDSSTPTPDAPPVF